ncbi:MAG: 16S rRNA (cytidine(1402)-2'-O)-methyltransferase [Succinivibrionaceae bacterium]
MLELMPALYIVPTPIGNLKDITYRAVEVLKEVDIICAEDTRHSLPLLEHIGVKNAQLESFYNYNEAQKSIKITEYIQLGKSVALISDAGTPLVSDPGYHLVKACVDRGIKVIPLPGPCAAITALCACGMPTDRFTFEGFLPVKEKALRDKLECLYREPRTMIFYESPRRIFDSAKIISEIYSDRDIMVARELTKAFESFYYSKGRDLLGILEKDPNITKGEMVIVISPYRQEQEIINDDALKLLKVLLDEMPTKKACSIVADFCNLKKNDLYKIALDISEENN